MNARLESSKVEDLLTLKKLRGRQSMQRALTLAALLLLNDEWSKFFPLPLEVTGIARRSPRTTHGNTIEFIVLAGQYSHGGVGTWSVVIGRVSGTWRYQESTSDYSEAIAMTECFPRPQEGLLRSLTCGGAASWLDAEASRCDECQALIIDRCCPRLVLHAGLRWTLFDEWIRLW